jgi:uncharacterized repeat protein (TIGR01451 family)
MSRIFSASLVPVAAILAATVLSACSDVNDPVSTRSLAPSQPNAIWIEPVPVLAVTPDTLAFGAVQVGSKSATKTVTITNIGTAPLRLWGAYAYGLGDFLPVTNTDSNACVIQQPIPPATQCTFKWEFQPLTVGARTGVQEIESDGGKISVQFTGSGYSIADVAVGIAANPTTAQVGKPLTYAVTLKNLSGSVATGVTLTDSLPAGTTFASYSAPLNAQCTTPAVGGTGAVTCSFAKIAGGFAYTIQLGVNVLSGGRTSLSNTATVTTTSTDPVSANNSATLVIPVRGKK